jgi:iron complex outermembrane receptor protein
MLKVKLAVSFSPAHENKEDFAMRHSFKVSPFASVVILAFYGSMVAAQSLQLEEIVVTAQKRVESVQNVPATVNVIDGDTLKDFNVFGFLDLEALTAGLQIDSFTGRSGRMTLRGINYNPNSAAEAAVATYWNQAIVDSNAVYQQLFDIQRIEVLRGPQGTLAGRTSPAGAINIHTAKPNLDEAEGEVRATLTDNDGINTQLAASLPLIPGRLALRFAGVFDENDMDETVNVLTGETSATETTAGRFSLSWLLTDSLSIDFAAQYLERDFDDLGVLSGVPAGDPRLDPEGLLPSLNSYDRSDARVGIDGVSDNTQSEYLNTSLVMNWDLGSHTVTSVTGYHETDSVRIYDQAQGSSNPGNVAQRIAVDDRTDFSQELRFASNEGERWDYMVGLYYEDSDIFFSQDNLQIPLSPFAGGSTMLLFPAESERWGLFTHNQFYLSEQWTLQLGLRYQEIQVDRDISLVAGPSGISVAPPGFLLEQVISDDNRRYDDDSLTGQLALEYTLSDDINFYGVVSTGWRPGGVTVTGSALPEDVLLFDAEDSISYELGFKSTLADGAVRLNGALYSHDFDDYISRQNALNIINPDGSIDRSGITANGDAEVWGAELELSANLSANWYLGGSLSYTEGEYASGTSLPCNEFDDNGVPIFPTGQPVAQCDESGNQLGRVPEWTASVNTEYRVDFGGFEGYGRALFAYTGNQNAEAATITTPAIDLDAYSTLDAYLGVRTDRWHVEVFARNLLDEEALITRTNGTAIVRRQPTGYANHWPIPGRRLGLSASYRW